MASLACVNIHGVYRSDDDGTLKKLGSPKFVSYDNVPLNKFMRGIKYVSLSEGKYKVMVERNVPTGLSIFLIHDDHYDIHPRDWPLEQLQKYVTDRIKKITV